MSCSEIHRSEEIGQRDTGGTSVVMYKYGRFGKTIRQSMFIAEKTHFHYFQNSSKDLSGIPVR